MQLKKVRINHTKQAPQRAYLYFLAMLLCRQKGTYIFPCLVLFFPILAGVISSGKITGVPPLLGLVLMAVTFVFLVVFVATKTVSVFKDNDSFGVEVLLLAKPITRYQLVIGKYIVVATCAVGISLVLFIGTGFGVLANQLLFNPDEQTTGYITAPATLNLTYACLMFLAALVLSLLFTGITSLICLRCSRQLSISLPILLFAAMDVASLVAMVPTLSIKGSNANNFLDANIDEFGMYRSAFANKFEYLKDANGNLEINYQVVPVLVPNGGDSWSVTQQINTPEDAKNDVANLQQIWSDNINSGHWYTVLKWLDVAAPLLEGNKLFSSGQGYTTRYAFYSAVDNPNYTYSAEFSNAWEQVNQPDGNTLGKKYLVATIKKQTERSPSWAVILAWSIVALGLLGASWYIYLRKDYK